MCSFLFIAVYLRCCLQILHELDTEVNGDLSEGTLSLYEGIEVHIDVLPLRVLLVCQFLEVGKEIAFHLLPQFGITSSI